MKDALECLKSKALGPVIYSPFTMRSNAVVARSGRTHSIAREPLQDNDEVRKIDASHCGRQ